MVRYTQHSFMFYMLVNVKLCFLKPFSDTPSFRMTVTLRAVYTVILTPCKMMLYKYSHTAASLKALVSHPTDLHSAKSSSPISFKNQFVFK